MDMMQHSESRIIGQETWWNTELQEFKPRRFDLDKIPLKFRCPNCGKVVVKPEDRELERVVDEEDRRVKDIEIKRLLELEKPPREKWDDFVKRHEELFIPLVHLVERDTPIDLAWYGGVCKNCWLDGFGKHGTRGAFMKKQLEKDKEKDFNTADTRKSLWINGKLRRVPDVIEVSYDSSI